MTLAAICLRMAAGAGALEAQSVGVGPEVGKLRLAVMDLNGSALRIQQIQGQTAQGGGVQATQTVNLPAPPEFARTLTEMLTTTLTATGRFVVLERQQMQAITAALTREAPTLRPLMTLSALAPSDC